METLAFLLLVAMQRNNTGPASVSMEVFNLRLSSNDKNDILRLHSNDGIRPSTSQYVLGAFC
jgi:hypothetical protein